MKRQRGVLEGTGPDGRSYSLLFLTLAVSLTLCRPPFPPLCNGGNTTCLGSTYNVADTGHVKGLHQMAVKLQENLP